MSQKHNDDVTHLDLQVVIELQQLLGDNFPDLVNTFLNDSMQRIGELEQTITSAVAKDIRHTAHSLKGSCLNLGALPLSELCRQLEEMALRGRLQRPDDLLQKIKIEFDHVANELQNIEKKKL